MEEVSKATDSKHGPLIFSSCLFFFYRTLKNGTFKFWEKDVSTITFLLKICIGQYCYTCYLNIMIIMIIIIIYDRN